MIKDNFSFIKIGKIDIQPYKKIINEISFDEWNKYQWRQKTFDVHKDTKTIPLIFDELNKKRIRHHQLGIYENLIIEIIKNIKTFYKNQVGIQRCILVNLPKNSKIPSHIDWGDSLENSKRIHVPIITNNKCFFTVGKDTIHMKSGEIWEINNTNKHHSVINDGCEDRIHLILDIVLTPN